LPVTNEEMVVWFNIQTSFPFFIKVYYNRVTGEALGVDAISPVLNPDEIQKLFADEAGNHPNQRTDEG